MGLNLNCVAPVPGTSQRMVCCRVAALWIELRADYLERRSEVDAAPAGEGQGFDYAPFETVDGLSQQGLKAAALWTSVPERTTSSHLLQNAQFGEFLGDQFQAMQGQGPRFKHFMVLNDCHAMALELRIATDGQGVDRFRVAVYNPNRTAQHLNMQTPVFAEIANWSLEDFVGVDDLDFPKGTYGFHGPDEMLHLMELARQVPADVHTGDPTKWGVWHFPLDDRAAVIAFNAGAYLEWTRHVDAAFGPGADEDELMRRVWAHNTDIERTGLSVRPPPDPTARVLLQALLRHDVDIPAASSMYARMVTRVPIDASARTCFSSIFQTHPSSWQDHRELLYEAAHLAHRKLSAHAAVSILAPHVSLPLFAPTGQPLPPGSPRLGEWKEGVSVQDAGVPFLCTALDRGWSDAITDVARWLKSLVPDQVSLALAEQIFSAQALVGEQTVDFGERALLKGHVAAAKAHEEGLKLLRGD